MKNIGSALALRRVFESLRMDNGFEVEQSFVKKFIDYNEVKFVRLRHLLGGVLQAQLDHLRAVFSTALQPSAPDLRYQGQIW